MANTYTQLFVHAVFVVKSRQNIISKDYQGELYKYITGIVQKKGNKMIIINGMPDHIHILIGLNPEQSLSALMKELKRCSSMFINERHLVMGKFEWQSGYAAFTYSKSQIDNVYNYIKNQQLHHSHKSFREEIIELLEKFNIEYNVEYILKDVYI